MRRSIAKDAAAAREAALALIPDGSTVGIPGSVTVREIGLPEALKKKGCVTAEHWAPDMTKDERKKALLAELTSDWFVTSANALSMDGVIVNIERSNAPAIRRLLRMRCAFRAERHVP